MVAAYQAGHSRVEWARLFERRPSEVESRLRTLTLVMSRPRRPANAATRVAAKYIRVGPVPLGEMAPATVLPRCRTPPPAAAAIAASVDTGDHLTYRILSDGPPPAGAQPAEPTVGNGYLAVTLAR